MPLFAGGTGGGEHLVAELAQRGAVSAETVELPVLLAAGKLRGELPSLRQVELRCGVDQLTVEVEDHLAAAPLECRDLTFEFLTAALGGIATVFGISGVVSGFMPAEEEQCVDPRRQSGGEDARQFPIVEEGFPVLVAHNQPVPAGEGADRFRLFRNFHPGVAPAAVMIGGSVPGAGDRGDPVAGDSATFPGIQEGIFDQGGVDSLFPFAEQMERVGEGRVTTGDIEALFRFRDQIAVDRRESGVEGGTFDRLVVLCHVIRVAGCNFAEKIRMVLTAVRPPDQSGFRAALKVAEQRKLKFPEHLAGIVPGVAELRVELQFIRCEPDFDVDFEVRLSRGGPRPRVVQHEPVRSGLRDCDCAGVGADLLLQLCSVLTDDSPAYSRPVSALASETTFPASSRRNRIRLFSSVYIYCSCFCGTTLLGCFRVMK